MSFSGRISLGVCLATVGALSSLLAATPASAHWEADPPRHRTNIYTWGPQIDLPTGWDLGLGYAATVWDNVSLQCHDFGVRPVEQRSS